VEGALYRTLQTAEQSSANLLDQTRKDAELSIKEANMRAESILKDAQWRAKTIIEEAEEEARKTFKALQQEIKSLEIEYRTVENQRDNLLTELLNLAKDIEERVNRSLDRTQPAHQPIALSSPGSAARRGNIPKQTPGPSAPPLIDTNFNQAPKQTTTAPISDAPLFAALEQTKLEEEHQTESKEVENTISESQPETTNTATQAPVEVTNPKANNAKEGSFFDQFSN
jgi:cell division initiation protein